MATLRLGLRRRCDVNEKSERRGIGGDAWDAAVAAHREGDLPKAERLYRRAADEGDPDAAYQLGTLLLDRHEYVGAARAFQQAANEGDDDALVNLANLYSQHLGRRDEAFRMYTTAIEKSSSVGGRLEGSETEVNAHLGLGTLLADLDRDQDAVSEFQRAAELGSPDGWKGLAAALARLGRLDEAEAILRRDALRADPESSRILGNVLHRQGRVQEAERAFKRALDAGHAVALLEYGDLLAACGRSQDAEGAYRAALDHGFSEAHRDLAELYRQTGRVADAEAEERLASTAES